MCALTLLLLEGIGSCSSSNGSLGILALAAMDIQCPWQRRRGAKDVEQHLKELLKKHIRLFPKRNYKDSQYNLAGN